MAQMAISQPRSAIQLRFRSVSLRLMLITQARDSCSVPRIKQNFIMAFCWSVAATPK